MHSRAARLSALVTILLAVLPACRGDRDRDRAADSAGPPAEAASAAGAAVDPASLRAVDDEAVASAQVLGVERAGRAVTLRLRLVVAHRRDGYLEDAITIKATFINGNPERDLRFANYGMVLIDSKGIVYRLSPPPGNPEILVPRGTTTEATLAFLGRIDPGATELRLRTNRRFNESNPYTGSPTPRDRRHPGPAGGHVSRRAPRPAPIGALLVAVAALLAAGGCGGGAGGGGRADLGAGAGVGQPGDPTTTTIRPPRLTRKAEQLARTEVVLEPPIVSEILGAPAGGSTAAGSTIGASQATQAQQALSELGATRTVEGLVVILPEQVLFDFDKADVRPDTEATLAKVAQVVGHYAPAPVRVTGHTDARGGDDYNQRLSERRAAAVADFLAARHQVPRDRLTAVGEGEGRPVAPNDTEENRQRNRRVEVTIGS